jgi:hypothetical protein
MPRWIACLAAALLLTACDAGHPTPGSDNLWPGPELDIQVPGPRTTVSLTWPAPVKQDVGGAILDVPQGKPRPRLFFRVRPLGEAGNLRVRYALDEGVFHTVENATEALTMKEDPAPGTRLISAYLVKADGAPRFGARATTVSTFIAVVFDEASGETLGKDANNPGTAQYGYLDEEQVWHPFDPKAPCLVVDAQGDRIHVLAHRCALDGKHYRVRYTLDGTEGTIAGDDVDSGRFGATIDAADAGTILIVLEEHVTEDADAVWRQVKGSRSTWARAGE